MIRSMNEAAQAEANARGRLPLHRYYTVACHLSRRAGGGVGDASTGPLSQSALEEASSHQRAAPSRLESRQLGH